MRTPYRHLILVAVALAAGLLLTSALVRGRKAPERVARPTPPPVVRVEEASFREVRLDVRSQGDVTPRTQTDLVAQVGGQVTEVSPSLVAGGFFRANEVLARIDATDFRLAVTSAEAAVARAELALAREDQEAQIALKEWEELGGAGDPEPLVRREPQLAEARASVASARASLEKARVDLGRTAIRVPYEGRVREKFVDVGQFVTPGAPLARVYATDAVEVRLAIPGDQLGFLDLPTARGDDRAGPAVLLTAQSGGQSREWKGRIVRTEGVIDPMTRMIHVVARVENSASEEPPGIGVFVDAAIEGRTVSGLVVLPRSALRDGDTGHEVLIVDDEDRLRVREVGVLRVDRETVIVNAGLEVGDRVCVSPLDVSIDGMPVRVQAGAE